MSDPAVRDIYEKHVGFKEDVEHAMAELRDSLQRLKSTADASIRKEEGGMDTLARTVSSDPSQALASELQTLRKDLQRVLCAREKELGLDQEQNTRWCKVQHHDKLQKFMDKSHEAEAGRIPAEVRCANGDGRGICLLAIASRPDFGVGGEGRDRRSLLLLHQRGKPGKGAPFTFAEQALPLSDCKIECNENKSGYGQGGVLQFSVSPALHPFHPLAGVGLTFNSLLHDEKEADAQMQMLKDELEKHRKKNTELDARTLGTTVYGAKYCVMSFPGKQVILSQATHD